MSLCTWVATLLAAARDQGDAGTRTSVPETPDAGTRMLARIRSSTTLAAVAFLGACSAEAARQAEERELALAAGASEQVTSEFAEEAFESARAREQFETLRKRWETLGFVEPCPGPAVDRSNWQRVSFEPLPLSMTFPLGYKIPERRQRSEYRDSMYVELQGPDGKIELRRVSGPSSVSMSSGYAIQSACDDMINGSPVRLESALDSRGFVRKHVLASFRLPSGGYLFAHADVRSVEAQAQALAAIRTIQFRYLWK